MGKGSIFIVLFLWAFVSLGYACDSTRIKLIETYESQIGIRELGYNRGDEVESYLASTGLDGGYAWCAAFVNWCCLQNGIKGPYKAAWSPSWFIYSHLINKQDALPGDVFGIYFQSKHRIAHVGFIDENWRKAGNTILTVEGNTNEAGSREGDGVYRKRRSKRQIYRVSRWL